MDEELLRDLQSILPHRIDTSDFIALVCFMIAGYNMEDGIPDIIAGIYQGFDMCPPDRSKMH